MATLTIRNLRDSTRQALRERAARNGRSMEAEVREILDDVTAISEVPVSVPHEPGLTEYEKQHLTSTQQEALLRLRKAFAPKPGEGSLVDEFLRERRALWGEE
jgi:plasmid stability protein